MTKIKDIFGEEHEVELINSPDSPYLEYEYKVVQKMYNPNYGDNRKCVCGHSYYRHFDLYDKSRRIQRGLFQSETGLLINSDVNGSLQIMKKVFPNAISRYGIEAVLTPIVISVA